MNKQKILEQVQQTLKDLKREKGIRIDVNEDENGIFAVYKYTTAKVPPYAEYKTQQCFYYKDVKKLQTAIEAIATYLMLV